MSEDTDIPEKEPQSQEPPKSVTVKEFDAVDFEAALLDGLKVEPQELRSQYAKLARDAEAKQFHSGARVYGLLSGVCGIHLNLRGARHNSQGLRAGRCPCDPRATQGYLRLRLVELRNEVFGLIHLDNGIVC